MSQLTILYYSLGDCKENLRFRESCQNHGLRLEAYSSIEGFGHVVKSCDSEYIVHADAARVIALRGNRDIVDLLKAATLPIIAGDRIPQFETNERINSSTDMQFKNSVMTAFAKRLAAEWLIRDHSIDIYCNLFQPIHGEKLGVSLIIDPNLHLLQNTDTGAYPCFVWFNQSGKELETAMQEFEEWSK